MYSKILVPVDNSEPSKLGLAEAVKLAKALHARICLIHVVDVDTVLVFEVDAINREVIRGGLRRAGAAVLQGAYEFVRKAGVEVDTALPENWNSPVGACIVNKAREYGAELIICGTHGRRGVRRVLVGSDAEYIVRHSPVPVLLVRPQDTASEATQAPVGAAA
ncbi:MAG TPA: universal stress protein [Steroidobacteraceae bacterium]|nr:universal stress protein [Steroidobacteraceae bacterium]